MEFLNAQNITQTSHSIAHLAGILGSTVDLTGLKQLFVEYGQGDFSNFPNVSVCSRTYLEGARSGYVLESDTICVAEDFVAVSSETQITTVLLQEMFNAIESRARYRAS